MVSSPVLRQRRVNISHEFTTGMAGVINQFTQQQSAALEEQKVKYHKYIKRLKRELSDESEAVARQSSQIQAQVDKINGLQASKEEMTGRLLDVEAKLETSEDRARRLEEKYRTCKAHLNSAIKEQQELYTRSKKQWEETIEQVRVMERSQNTDREMAIQKAEVIRSQMMEKMRQTIAQNKSESSECKHQLVTKVQPSQTKLVLLVYDKINVLAQQVEEKDAELRRERESVRGLSEKLQELQHTSTGFETLASQGREILDRLGEQATKADEQRQKSVEGFLNR